MSVNILASYPFGYTNEQGEQVGTYWEYVQTLSSRLSFPVQQDIVPKARVVEHLKMGWADAAILFRSKRMKEHVEFVSKIREIPIVIASKTGFVIENYDQLSTASFVGHFRSGSVSPVFDNDASLNKIAINTYPQMIEMLEKQRVEAIVGNGIVIQSLIKKNCLENDIKISPFTFGVKEQWLVVSKKSDHLEKITEFQTALVQMKSEGVLDQIFTKHLTQSSNHCTQE